MSIYNNFTKQAHYTIKLIERDERNDESVWEVVLDEDIDVNRTDGEVIKAGATFTYKDEYDATEDDAYSYVLSHGILDACNVSDAELESDYLHQ